MLDEPNDYDDAAAEADILLNTDAELKFITAYFDGKGYQDVEAVAGYTPVPRVTVTAWSPPLGYTDAWHRLKEDVDSITSEPLFMDVDNFGSKPKSRRVSVSFKLNDITAKLTPVKVSESALTIVAEMLGDDVALDKKKHRAEMKLLPSVAAPHAQDVVLASAKKHVYIGTIAPHSNAWRVIRVFNVVPRSVRAGLTFRCVDRYECADALLDATERYWKSEIRQHMSVTEGAAKVDEDEVKAVIDILTHFAETYKKPKTEKGIVELNKRLARHRVVVDLTPHPVTHTAIYRPHTDWIELPRLKVEAFIDSFDPVRWQKGNKYLLDSIRHEMAHRAQFRSMRKDAGSEDAYQLKVSKFMDHGAKTVFDKNGDIQFSSYVSQPIELSAEAYAAVCSAYRENHPSVQSLVKAALYSSQAYRIKNTVDEKSYAQFLKYVYAYAERAFNKASVAESSVGGDQAETDAILREIEKARRQSGGSVPLFLRTANKALEPFNVHFSTNKEVFQGAAGAAFDGCVYLRAPDTYDLDSSSYVKNLRTILHHELVHLKQYQAAPEDKWDTIDDTFQRHVTNASGQMDRDRYLGHRHELMAYAATLVDEWKRRNTPKGTMLHMLKHGQWSGPFGQARALKQKNPKLYQQFLSYAVDYVNRLSESLYDEITKEAEKAEEPKSAEHAEAGTYKKGHVNFDGFGITIENAKGSVRSGEDKDGKAWSIVLPAHYGYFATVGGETAPRGKDKDHIDCYIGENPGGMLVFVVNQNKIEGGFDEHKVFLGFNSKDEAIRTYDRAFSGDLGPKLRGTVVSTTVKKFKAWLKDGDVKVPFKSEAAESVIATVCEAEEEYDQEYDEASFEGPPITWKLEGLIVPGDRVVLASGFKSEDEVLAYIKAHNLDRYERGYYAVYYQKDTDSLTPEERRIVKSPRVFVDVKDAPPNPELRYKIQTSHGFGWADVRENGKVKTFTSIGGAQAYAKVHKLRTSNEYVSIFSFPRVLPPNITLRVDFKEYTVDAAYQVRPVVSNF